MDLGKVGLVAGGVLVVGTVGAIALGVPLQVDALVPVGVLDLQTPVQLFELENEPVAAPEVDVAPGEPEILVAPLPAAEGGTTLDAEEIAPVEEQPEAETLAAVESATAVEAASEVQAEAGFHGTCAGHP